MKKQEVKNYSQCPIEATLALIQGKWKVVIMFRLKDEPRRFNELSRLLPNITQRMLTNQLRELEKDGLVHRKIYPQVPPAYSGPFRSIILVLTDHHFWNLPTTDSGFIRSLFLDFQNH